VTATSTHVRAIADQVYSHAGGVARLADVYLPESPNSPPPVVIWLHGGGWRFGDRRLAPDLTSFAQRSGLAVVSIDYRLSDEAKFPAQAEDVKTAVRWVRRVAGQFGFDGDNIGLWGSSAGGHLAGCAAISQEQDFASPEHAEFSSCVQAVVDGYGPTNFGQIDAGCRQSATIGTDAESLGIGSVIPAGHPDSFESKLLGSAVSESPSKVELADPVHYIRRGCPPFLIVHGESDTLIPSSQSQHLYDALVAKGNEAVLVLFEKLGHGFFNNKNLADENYGKVTVHGENLLRWTCDPKANLPQMVIAFFQAHLLPRGNQA
jgi:acetyl esterase/lipase